MPLMERCRRDAVERGELVIVKCGDNTLHPLEARFVRPEVRRRANRLAWNDFLAVRRKRISARAASSKFEIGER